jgi:hypothetical protein
MMKFIGLVFKKRERRPGIPQASAPHTRSCHRYFSRQFLIVQRVRSKASVFCVQATLENFYELSNSHLSYWSGYSHLGSRSIRSPRSYKLPRRTFHHPPKKQCSSLTAELQTCASRIYVHSEKVSNMQYFNLGDNSFLYNFFLLR